MRWLLLCLISVGYAQVLPYTDVNSTNTVTLSNKTITSAVNTLTIDCNVSTCTNFPLGGSAGNPTAKVGTAAVNGVLGTYMRSDAAPPIDLTFSPTWTGTHTFNGTVAGTALSTYLASPPAIGGSAPAAGAFTTLSATGAITSTLATGTAPFTVASTTNVANLNASLLNGATFAAPGAIGGGTAAAGTFTALTGTSGSLTGLTAFGIRDTSAAFDVTLAAVSNTALTAGRTLTFNMQNVAHTLAFSATANTITFPNTSSYTLIGSGDSGTVTNTMLAGSITLANLATQATNTVVGNATSGSAAPTALSVGGCSTSASALIWTTNTGFGCNTSINAGTLGGATFASPAAIGSGTPAAGNFTTLGTSGLFSPALGITATGAAVSLNDSQNFNTTINTGTSTGTVTIGQNTATPSAIALKGPVSFQAGTAFSGTSWTTTSPVWNIAAMTLNDTTASGTIALEAGITIQPVTFTSTGGASTTITAAPALYIPVPVCSGGVVCTNKYGLYTTGNIFTTLGFTSQGGGAWNGGTISIQNNSNNAVNIGTGSDNALVTIGGGSNAVTINATTLTLGGSTLLTSSSPSTFSNAAFKLTGVTTGTNADTLCLKADGTVLIQAAACTISSLRFKENVEDIKDSTIPQIANMRVASFRMKDGAKNADPNAASTQTGLIAENIATVAPECAIYESDMKTPKSYRQECVIALLVKGEQELVEQNAMLKARIEQLEAH